MVEMDIHSVIAPTLDNNNAKHGVDGQQAGPQPKSGAQPLSTLGGAACCGGTTPAGAAGNNPQRKHAMPTSEQAGDEPAVTIMANSTAALLGKLAVADTRMTEAAAAIHSAPLPGDDREPADVRASSLRSAKALEPGTPAQSLEEPITKMKSLGSLKTLEPGTPAQSLEPITKKSLSLGSLGAHHCPYATIHFIHLYMQTCACACALANWDRSCPAACRVCEP